MTAEEEFIEMQENGCTCEFAGESDTIAGAPYIMVSVWCPLHGSQKMIDQKITFDFVRSIFDK